MRANIGAHRAPQDDSLDDAAPPSQRATLDVAAIASIAGLHDSRGNVPLDFCVPVRTARPMPPTISSDEIYVLLYVDGATSLGQIAEETSLSFSETVSIVLGLLARGIVQIDDEDAPPPRSQTMAKRPPRG